jgi:protein SCO1/2
VKARAILIAFALVLPSAAGARVDSSAFPQLAFGQHPGAQLPRDAQLTNEAGKPTTLGRTLNGRPAILVLEYLRCRSLCSLVLAGAVNALQQAQLTPGKQLQFVAVSIDLRDTSSDAAAARARYASRFADAAAAGQGMHFLTGSPNEVARIASTVGFPYRYDKASGQFAHPAGFVVVTPSGTISRYMLGLNPDPGLLRQAVNEAGQGTVEPPAHPLLLLCFGYDPDEGTAAALAMRLVRWVSFAAVLGCAALIGFLSLRRRAA